MTIYSQSSFGFDYAGLNHWGQDRTPDATVPGGWEELPASTGPETEAEKVFEKRPPAPSVERRMLPSWM